MSAPFLLRKEGKLSAGEKPPFRFSGERVVEQSDERVSQMGDLLNLIFYIYINTISLQWKIRYANTYSLLKN